MSENKAEMWIFNTSPIYCHNVQIFKSALKKMRMIRFFRFIQTLLKNSVTTQL